MRSSSCSTLFAVFLVLSCTPAESAPRAPEPQPLPLPEPMPAASGKASAAVSSETWERDPFNGTFSLDDATKGMTGRGPLVATLDTSKGSLRCALFDDRAPIAVANFVGLARGTRPWKDPAIGRWAARPAYDGTIFHRIIQGFMIQGGDPLGTGKGQPGYVFKDEIWDGAKHDRPGLLCTANRGKDTNGVQFFITDAAAAHLDGNYTIFGECGPVKTVHAIANVAVDGERPLTPVTLDRVTIARETP